MSDVRRIDPATYQPPQPRPASARPPLARQKSLKLLEAADAILLADAKRRRYRDLTRKLIENGRYR